MYGVSTTVHSARPLPINILAITVLACMFFFGLTTCLQGFAQGFGGLVTARVFLGT